jgi:hypothetical protein
MALITDPDLLADSNADDGSEEVYINTATKKIKLVVVGNLSTDGVTLKALYSFLKEEWKNDPNSKNLAAFPFPMVPITDEAFELVDGWDFFNDTARYLIRTGGWTVRNTSGNTVAQWAGIVGLGSIESNDQLYYYQGAGSPTNFQLQGQVNQAIQILRDDDGDGNFAEGSDFDYRTSLSLFGREQAQLFGKSTLSDIGVTTMAAQVYRFPISTAADLKVVADDTDIKASGSGYPADVAPYSGMTITYYTTPQSQSGFVGGSYNFGITVDANGQTLQKAYEFVQYALRQSVDIDDGAGGVIGKTADALMHYVGDTLYTDAATNTEGGGTGVFIDNFDLADQNSVYFTDNTGAQRQYPYSANLTLSFNSNLVSDGAAKYWVYFTTLPVVARTVTDAAITASDATLTSATASFVSTDKDALILIEGAGAAGADLEARIVSVTNSTTVEITPSASTTVTGSDLAIYGGDWGEAGALLAQTDAEVDITGTIVGTPVTVAFDYDGNTQGGRTAATDADITVVAIGLNTGQYVRATGTILRSKTNAIALVAPLERNYANA